MARQFEAADEGMTVKTASGDEIGTIESIEGNRAHVTPSSGLSQSIRKRLGWTKENEAVYELRHSKVSEFTDDAVVLKD
ncbi:hypothetical protein [Haloarcula montana]|uniref:hypothetical protein n=1 Tax=Haloarcula montana TaxID=3111776 RepID=UPI002D7829DA|nr:hypothetical protein [Haloarcula sp. GH36]